jgi:aspartate kinase
LVVFKFGGTSVGVVRRFRNVVRIVTEATRSSRVVVVHSALSRVTRQLDQALHAFTADTSLPNDTILADLLHGLRRRHREHAAALLSPPAQMQYASIVEKRLARLREIFEDIDQDGARPARRDAVLAAGEQLATPLVALALEEEGLDAPLGDATRLLTTDASFGAARVNVEASRAALRDWYSTLSSTAVPVLAGFIGSTPQGETTTLGFEGSDYSAALFASILNADMLVRYTDVDGLYTDDPHVHHDATPIDCISMEDAVARTEAGELGMHPKTLRPLVDAGIPLYIRSIVDPEAPGTSIVPQTQMASTR